MIWLGVREEIGNDEVHKRCEEIINAAKFAKVFSS